MVEHTGNSSVAPTASTNLSTNNYVSSTLKMNLPQHLINPIDLWSKSDVQKWIEYCIDEYSLGDVNLNDFEMNGKALLLLNEDSFRKRSPRSGDILYKALQQHRIMLKSWVCQTFPYPMWNNFPFPIPTSTTHRFNIPTPPSISMSPFHPSSSATNANTAAAVAAAAAAACMHPAFSYNFNRPEMNTKPSTVNHQTSHTHSLQQQISVINSSHRSDYTNSVNDSNDIKREVASPNMTHSNRQPTPNSSPATTTTSATATTISPSIKQECVDDEDVDIEQNETAPTPPITSSSPSSSPQSLLSVGSKLNNSTNNTTSYNIHTQLLSRIKQQPNDVTNTGDNHDDLDGNNQSYDNTRQIRYFHDRIDFRGDILMKPPAAKNCRILWEFLYILLEDPHYESIIHWENREKMIFRIIQADKLAALWGLQKNRLSMTYEKLSRGMRYYYSNNIISKEQSKRLLYRFMRSPDEIRKSMKRNGGTTNMVYSNLNKKSTNSYQTVVSPVERDINIKYDQDNEDNSSISSSSSNVNNNQHQLQITNPLLQLFSIYSPSATSMASSFNSAAALLLASRNTNDNKLSSLTLSKSDRSSSSSPDSLDGNRDRTSDTEKQHCSPSQSTSTKRKQAVPLSLTARLSHQQHQVDQPLNLAVHKDEGKTEHSKKQKVLSAPSVA